jgi:vacuolar-type H+-ATPase subunit I/STV1
MGWFRSAEMKYMSLVVPETQIYQILCELGERGVVQFTDVRSSIPLAPAVSRHDSLPAAAFPSLEAWTPTIKCCHAFLRPWPFYVLSQRPSSLPWPVSLRSHCPPAVRTAAARRDRTVACICCVMFVAFCLCARCCCCCGCCHMQLNKNATAYQRTYANQVKVCNTLQRMVKFMEEELKKLEVELPAAPESPTLIRELIEKSRNSQVPPSTRLSQFEQELKKHETDLRDLSENYQKLLKVYNSKLELRCVLQEALNYSDSNSDELMAEATAANPGDVVKFNYMTGVINDAEYLSFQKMIFRATRGNCFVRFTPILGPNKADGSPGDPVQFVNPLTEEKVEKHVFMAMFPGKQIESQLRKICDAYGANVYVCVRAVCRDARAVPMLSACVRACGARVR